MHKVPSFPFLAIAKKYNLPYDMVLQIANDLHAYIREQGYGAIKYMPKAPDYWVSDIMLATQQFYLIQLKYIDWQTGERTSLLEAIDPSGLSDAATDPLGR